MGDVSQVGKRQLPAGLICVRVKLSLSESDREWFKREAARQGLPRGMSELLRRWINEKRNALVRHPLV